MQSVRCGFHQRPTGADRFFLVFVGFFWFYRYNLRCRKPFSVLHAAKTRGFYFILGFFTSSVFSVFAGFSWFLPVRGDANFVSWILMRFEVFPIGSQAFVGCYAINNGYKMIISVWGRTLGVTIIYTCTPKVPPVFLCIFVVSLDRKLYFKSLIRTLRKNGFQGRKPVFLPKTTTWLSISIVVRRLV